MAHVSTETVRDAARGQWLSIMASLAPELSGALQKVGRHVPCPVHGGRDGLRTFRDVAETGGVICNTCGEFPDGFAALMWINGWDFVETKQAVADFLRLDAGPDRLPPPVKRQRPTRPDTPPEETEARLAKLKEVWGATKPDDGTIAAYLKGRGLFLPASKELRLHPALPYYDGDGNLTGTFPAMAARVQALDGERVSIHRTYLAPGGAGKAPVESPKKLMRPIRDGAMMGAAIRLTEAGDTLALAEGIETALAVREACAIEGLELNVWATVSAGGMEAVRLPESVQTVHVCGDNDLSGRGQEAAEILARRLYEEGRTVYIHLPPTPGTDWLDVLNAHGHTAIWEEWQSGKPWTPSAPPVTVPTSQPGRGAGRSVKTYTEAEVMASQDPEWLVDGFLTVGGMSVLYGPSGAGKSFVAVDIAKSITAGRTWFGHAVKAGPVYYVAAEGKGGIKKRLRAWEIDRKVKSIHPLSFAFEPVKLMDEKSVHEFINVLAARPQRPTLVIFDTMARCMVGGDDNSARDVGQFVEGARMIQDAIGCAVMIIHHSNKGGTVERGSGALRAAADTMIQLTLEDDVLVLAVDKQKDGEAAPPLNLRQVPVMNSSSCVIGLADQTTSSQDLTPSQRKALKALALMPEGASRRDWQDACDMKFGQFLAVVKALVEKNLVFPPDEKPRRYRLSAKGERAVQ